MDESWAQIVIKYNEIDKSWLGGRRTTETSELSIEEIKIKIEDRVKEREINYHNVEARSEISNFIYAFEELNKIINCMIISGTKKSSANRSDLSYKCRVMLVALAIKRGLNAELSKDTESVIIDCY